MFFIISGLVIPWSLFQAGYRLNNFFRFLLKRLLRLEPPYIVSIIVAVSLLYIRKFSPYYNHFDLPFSGTQLMLHFGYMIPFFENYTWINQVYWTLAIEFQYYLSIGVFYFLIIHSNSFFRYLFYLITFSLQFGTSADFLPYWLPVFLLGILIFLKFLSKISNWEYYMVSIVCGAFILYRVGMPSFIICTVTVFAILLFRKRSNIVSKFLGNISYSLYLTHPLIGAAVVNYLSHIVSTPLQKVVVVLAGITATLLFSYLMYVVVEKPSKRISSKLKF